MLASFGIQMLKQAWTSGNSLADYMTVVPWKKIAREVTVTV